MTNIYIKNYAIISCADSNIAVSHCTSYVDDECVVKQFDTEADMLAYVAEHKLEIQNEII